MCINLPIMTSRGTVGCYLRELSIDELAGPIPKYVTHVLLYGLEPHDLKKISFAGQRPRFLHPFRAPSPLNFDLFLLQSYRNGYIYHLT